MTVTPALERLRVGAPGLYTLPDQPVRALTGARMDVCAFLGVAPRGPARPPRFEAPWAQRPCQGDQFPRSLAVPVESFDAYKRLYGSFEGPGRLPYAVASFFEQGGKRAYIVRIVHHYLEDSGGVVVPDDAANSARIATTEFSSTELETLGGHAVRLRARDEGAWGNRLTGRLSFGVRPLFFTPHGLGAIVVPSDEALPPWSLLRLRLPGNVDVLRYVSVQRTDWHPSRPELMRIATLHEPVAAVPEAVELVEATLDVDDHDGRVERHTALGLAADHPRFLGRVLCEDSLLLYPTQDWLTDAIAVRDARLAPLPVPPFSGGADDYPALVPEDFFDEYGWTPADACPGGGIQALVGIPDLGSVVVADLYSPEPIAKVEPIVSPRSLAGPAFAECIELEAPPVQQATSPDLRGLSLDPRDSADRERIVALQARVVEFAETQRDFVALLDVPPGLTQRQMLRWRQAFSSGFAAAYYPWLKTLRADDRQSSLVSVNPSAIAAGIIAQRELEHGIPHGPANTIAQGIVDVDDLVAPERHAELHQNGINVFLRERDGIQLSAARTLSKNPEFRQLSVRRLMTMLKRTLDVELQWAAFEPNDASLRSEVKRLLNGYLRRLWRANAFVGASQAEAFFVKCDDELNPPAAVDQGRLLAHIGVAPAEPLEFLVLQVSRGSDGTLAVED